MKKVNQEKSFVNQSLSTVCKGWIVACLLIMVSACGGEDAPAIPEVPKLASIKITEKISTIKVGEKHQFKASYSPVEAQAPTFSWEVSDKSIATVDQTGLLTALKDGEVKLVLTVFDELTNKPSFVDETTITVTPIEIESIKLSQETLSVERGKSTTLSVSFTPSNAKQKEIEWLSDNDEVATVSNGKVTGVKAGTATITAKVKGTEISASCSVTINPVLVSAIKFKDQSVSLLIGETKATEIVITPDDADSKEVIYESLHTGIATVDDKGVITAVGKGETMIKVSTKDGSLSALCEVKVSHFTDRITIMKSGSVISIGGYVTASVSVYLSNYSGKTITVKRFSVIDGSNREVYGVDMNEALSTGQMSGKSLSINRVYMPVYRYTYVVEGKEYTVELAE